VTPVVVVHHRAGRPGGVSVDVEQLHGGLTGRGWDVSVAGSTASLARMLRKRRRPLVNVFGCVPSATIFGSLAYARLHGCPLVWTPIFHPSRSRTWDEYGVLRAMRVFDLAAPSAARLVDTVVAETEEEAAFFLSRGASRAEVLPPAVPPPPPAAVPADELRGARLRLGLADGPVVLVVGRDNSRKALPFALAVHRRLRSLVPDAQLLLAGAGRASPEPGVVSTEWLEPPELERVYALADVLFVSSLYESFSRAVPEAWRHELPVVVTDRVGLAPLVDRSHAGRVTPYGDVEHAVATLRDVLDAPGTLGAAGRRLVE
jgi:glycosyltransferase involved in cell wall biosynthesis